MVSMKIELQRISVVDMKMRKQMNGVTRKIRNQYIRGRLMLYDRIKLLDRAMTYLTCYDTIIANL